MCGIASTLPVVRLHVWAYQWLLPCIWLAYASRLTHLDGPAPQVKGENTDINVKRLPKKPVRGIAH